MSAKQILNGLERSDTTGAEADAVARLGFLEWVFGQGGDVTAADARMALQSPEAKDADSDAARAFVGFLNDAAVAFTRTPVRRKTRRMLHS